jgi:putative ABC transport system permease protein
MRLTELLRLALDSIYRRKLRSALMLLGMTIGVTAVVVVVAFIQGFNAYVDEKVAGIGSKSFTIRRFSLEDFKNTDTAMAAQRRNKDLTLDDFEYLRERATLIRDLGVRVTPLPAQVKRGRETLEEVPVDGATPNIAAIENIEVADGRYFTEAENKAGARVAFIGASVADKLFTTRSAVANDISIAGLPYKVIGVAAAKGTVFGVPQDNFVTLPLKTYANSFGPLHEQRSLYFVASPVSESSSENAVEEVRFLMRARRRLERGEKDDFGIVTPEAIMGLRDRLFGAIFIVIIAVPSIALIISGVVIANIMLVNVTERTREIGIRKAVGARRIDILKQFLIEASMLAIVGGVLGILTAWLITTIVTFIFFPAHLSAEAVALALTASSIVGVSAGLVPAWKAARLSPIKALREGGLC